MQAMCQFNFDLSKDEDKEAYINIQQADKAHEVIYQLKKYLEKRLMSPEFNADSQCNIYEMVYEFLLALLEEHGIVEI